MPCRAAALIRSQQKYERGILKIAQNTFPFLILFRSFTMVWEENVNAGIQTLKWRWEMGRKAEERKI